jgi:hypothetical protein
MYYNVLNFLKHIVLFVILYILLCCVPNISKSKVEIGVITLIILLVYVLYESICNLFTSGNIVTNMCSAVCKRESFEKLPELDVVNPETDVIEQVLDKEENKITKDEIDEQKLHTKKTSIPVRKNNYEESVEVLKKRGIENEGTRYQKDVASDESEFDNQDYNQLPMGEQVNTGSFEYGYSYLPPEKWFPTPPVPPICVAEKRCPVTPVYTTGVPVDIKEWNSSRRVTQPDRINTKYIKRKLNSGR